MANKLTTLSQAVFDQKAILAVAKQPIRKQVSLGSIELVNKETLSVDGTPIPMTSGAFKDFIELLRIPKAFLTRFSDSFGEEGAGQLLNRLRTAISADSGLEVVLTVDPGDRKITAIRHPNHVGITNEGFLGLIRENVDRYDLQVSDFSVGPDGALNISAVSPTGFLQVPGMKKEIFSTGINFSNSSRGGTEVSPYLMRLVCSNGMMSRSFAEHYNLKGLDKEQVERFNDHMLKLQTNGFQPQGISDKVIKADMVNASLAEMQSAASAIMSNSKIEWKDLQKYVPIQDTSDTFSRHGMDSTRFTRLQQRNATTGTSLWNLVNGMTNFASNGGKVYFDDEIQRSRIMVAAGNLFARDTYDTENLVLSPYGSREAVEVETGDKW
jgi:hypothetical protein